LLNGNVTLNNTNSTNSTSSPTKIISSSAKARVSAIINGTQSYSIDNKTV